MEEFSVLFSPAEEWASIGPGDRAVAQAGMWSWATNSLFVHCLFLMQTCGVRSISLQWTLLALTPWSQADIVLAAGNTEYPVCPWQEAGTICSIKSLPTQPFCRGWRTHNPTVSYRAVPDDTNRHCWEFDHQKSTCIFALIWPSSSCKCLVWQTWRGILIKIVDFLQLSLLPSINLPNESSLLLETYSRW